MFIRPQASIALIYETLGRSWLKAESWDEMVRKVAIPKVTLAGASSIFIQNDNQLKFEETSR